LIANGKNRKKKIFQLEQEEGTIVGEDNLRVYITEFYKKLFGEPVPSNVSLMEEATQDIPQVSDEENSILTAPFTEKEVYEDISQMEPNKASGQMVFRLNFIKNSGK
jgi:hypothetical protein